MNGIITDTDRNFCATLFDVMEAHGVCDVVCCPGSRNAPLLIAAAARENLRKHNVIDERSAAFMALGMAVVSRRPVAVVCTSGTALLNFAPAVAEAFYQNVPLIVISADRPLQWIDQDDSQTMRQFEALSNFVKKSYELPAWGNGDSEMLWYANRIANDAMIEATTRRKGPVHINVRLGEPLGRKVERVRTEPRVIEMLNTGATCSKTVLLHLAEEMMGKRVMFVAGFMQPEEKMHLGLARLCAFGNVTPMTETLSNIHLRAGATDIDSVLTAYSEEKLDAMAPDLIISVGGALVSRKLKEYLRRNSWRCAHWSVGWNHTTSDCFMSLTKRIEADAPMFVWQLAAQVEKLYRKGVRCSHPDYYDMWEKARKKAAEAKKNFLYNAPWCELRAFDIITSMLNGSINLFLSNGTAVRYAQIFGHHYPHASYCNRGVSGIDGSCSTAIGAAKVYGAKTVLITGDMSMAYDMASLALPDVPEKMKIVVMDNNGGGIFRFIPTTSGLEEREQYFCCPPQLPLRQLAEGFGWDYAEAGDVEELINEFRHLSYSGRKGILRVVFDGEESAEMLRQYMNVKAKGGNK